MIFKALGAARDLGRLREIARVLMRHGFGELAQRTGLASTVHRAGRALRRGSASREDALSPPERARRAMEDLGPTFVKLGQVLAGRSDLLPPEWTTEFGRLHEQVRTIPFETLRGQVEKDLGASPETVFTDLDPEPLAAGSIAQVHRARLADGTQVVLKIRRPAVREEVLADLRLLARFADLVEREIPDLRRFRPRAITRQFSRSMAAELDLRVEARNLQAITDNVRERPAVVVPKVFEEWTRESLLVLSYLDGHSAAEWIRGDRPEGLDPVRLAEDGADAVLQMILVDGLYHADPHPGNVLFLPENRIGLLDFGMVGRLSERRRRQIVRLLAAIASHDEDGAVDVLLDWSHGGKADLDMLTMDVRSFIDRYYGVELAHLDVGALLRDVSELVRENDLSLPPDIAMLAKVFVTLEGLGRALSPGFDISAQMEPAARKMLRSLHAPRAMLRRSLRDLRTVLAGLPSDVRSLLSRARRGGFKVDLDLERLDDFGRQIDRSANRITVGLVTSALIIGTSVAMTVEGGPRFLGLPAFGLLGFLSSLGVGVVLLWSILRSGRR